MTTEWGGSRKDGLGDLDSGWTTTVNYRYGRTKEGRHGNMQAVSRGGLLDVDLLRSQGAAV